MKISSVSQWMKDHEIASPSEILGMLIILGSILLCVSFMTKCVDRLADNSIKQEKVVQVRRVK